LEDLVVSIFDRPWSPCVWAGGERAARNFQSSHVVALDFDGGRSISSVISQVHGMGLEFSIATTKSHRKEKVSASGIVTPACDRFRLIVPAARIVHTVEDYKWMMTAAMRTFQGADEACKDAARFFFPSVKLSCFGQGTGFDWTPQPSAIQYPAKKVNLAEKAIPGSLSDRVLKDLLTKFPAGQRHVNLRRLCVILGSQGIPRELAWGSILMNPTDYTEKEKRRIFDSSYNWGYLNGAKR
jgi:hypothetical protein